jgi:quercetin dioxygenase-like cupin family protein
MLLALARSYGTTVSELLGETVADRDAVVRAADMEPTTAGGWTYWQAGAPGRGMQALRVQVPYGSQGDIVRVHPGEEWLYVLRGPSAPRSALAGAGRAVEHAHGRTARPERVRRCRPSCGHAAARAGLAQRGRLRLRLGNTAHRLTAGDSAHFDSLTPHRIAAEDPDGVELLFVHTLLQSPTATLCLGTITGETS